MLCKFIVFGSLFILVLAGNREAIGLNLYQIGNSLTNDSQPNAIRLMAETYGLDWTRGYHIRNASTIRQIYLNPIPSNDASEPGPTWEEALPGNDWNALVLQPHNQNANTMETDVSYALQFVADSKSDGRNLETQLYIYSTWPTLSAGWSNWLGPVDNELTQPTIHRQQFFQHVAGRLAETLEKPVYVIPAGDVLYRVIQEVDSGNMPNLTSVADLYRDDIHLGNYGRLTAASTVLATVAGINPVGLPTTQFTSGEADTVLRIQQLAWDVVANHPYSGVVPPPGDFNGDGLVDGRDYAKWQDSFGATTLSYAADGNRDGVIDIADYALWRDRYQSGSAETISAAVPEPANGILLGVAAIVLLGIRRSAFNNHRPLSPPCPRPTPWL